VKKRDSTERSEKEIGREGGREGDKAKKFFIIESYHYMQNWNGTERNGMQCNEMEWNTHTDLYYNNQTERNGVNWIRME